MIEDLERIVKGQREYIEELRESIKMLREKIAINEGVSNRDNNNRIAYKKPTHLKIV